MVGPQIGITGVMGRRRAQTNRTGQRSASGAPSHPLTQPGLTPFKPGRTGSASGPLNPTARQPDSPVTPAEYPRSARGTAERSDAVTSTRKKPIGPGAPAGFLRRRADQAPLLYLQEHKEADGEKTSSG